MKLFLLVLGFTLFIEGVPYFVNPIASKKIMRLMIRQKSSLIRWMGLVMAVAGIAVMYIAKGFDSD